MNLNKEDFPCLSTLRSDSFSGADFIGPDQSSMFTFTAALGKHLRPGSYEVCGAVRWFLPELCPISSLAVLAAHEFGRPGRLCEENLRGYVFHAPGSPPGEHMHITTAISTIGSVLRAPGMLPIRFAVIKQQQGLDTKFRCRL